MKKMRVVVLLCIAIGFMTGNGFAADWSAMDSGTTNNLNGLWGSSGSDVFAVGDSGTILHYDGTAWSAVASPTTDNLNGIWGSSATHAFAVGDSGTILQYDGLNWLTVPSTTTNNLNSVWGYSDLYAYAVGDAGTFLYYNGSWSIPMPPGTFTGNLNTIWGLSGSNIFVVGDGGIIGHFGGIPGGFMDSGTTENLKDIWGPSSNSVYAVGSNGTFLFYDGYSWSAPMAGLFTFNDNAIWGSSGSDLFVVSDGGVIGYFGGSPPGGLMDSGTTENLYDVWGSSGADVFAVGANGTILHYSVQPPANDDFDNATPITGVPFTDSIDTRGATPAADDPTDCYGTNASVWYSFTPPSNTRISANTSGSDYSAAVAVYMGTRGSLYLIACDWCVTFDAVAGETYFFMVGNPYNSNGGNLVFNVEEVTPLTIDLKVDPINFVNNGITTVSGTVNSSVPVDAYVSVQVRQKAGRVFITGYNNTYVYAADGVAHWTMQVPGDIGPFLPGKATVRAIAQGCSYGGCGGGSCAETPEVAETVQLKPSHPTTTVPQSTTTIGPSDSDGDGIPDGIDNCPNICNRLQLDADGDGIGDVCDPKPGCGKGKQPACENPC